MMRNLPNCPRCSEPELCLYRAVDLWVCFCIECGWRTSQPLVDGVDIDDAIAAAVRAATPIDTDAESV